MPYVQFSDSTKQSVVSEFSCPQDIAEFPNQGELDSADERYLAFADPTRTLAGAQASQISVTTAYAAAASMAVIFTTAGEVTKTYQADQDSRDLLQYTLAMFQSAGITPAEFYWVSEDNMRVPFTYEDLQGLAAVFGAQSWPAFQKLQTLKASIRAAATVAEVQAIIWK